MKKTACTLLMLASIAITSGVSADDAAIQARVDQVKSEFNLNDQQAKRIAGILARASMSKEEKRTAKIEKHIQRRVQRMTKRLNLSDNQADQVKDIMTQQSTQMQALFAQGKADITAILTPEQAAEFATMSERKGKGWGGKHRKRGGHGSRCEKH